MAALLHIKVITVWLSYQVTVVTGFNVCFIQKSRYSIRHQVGQLYNMEMSADIRHYRHMICSLLFFVCEDQVGIESFWPCEHFYYLHTVRNVDHLHGIKMNAKIRIISENHVHQLFK